MINENLISAGEIRTMGFEVPADIPNCATIPKAAMILSPGKISKHQPNAPVLCVEMTCSFTEAFSWITVDAVIEKITSDGG